MPLLSGFYRNLLHYHVFASKKQGNLAFLPGMQVHAFFFLVFRISQRLWRHKSKSQLGFILTSKGIKELVWHRRTKKKISSFSLEKERKLCYTDQPFILWPTLWSICASMEGLISHSIPRTLLSSFPVSRETFKCGFWANGVNETLRKEEEEERKRRSRQCAYRKRFECLGHLLPTARSPMFIKT